ncbi:tRNA modification GTPase MnmE [Desulfosarcina widdelii]|uniref:tRNA modification GTPase MnmE n=1 Tax=Desulfosarcina widdelii TaxID=947919 RepID=A0A5K7Z450_9BACT|nr:tRNA uridine-5-carboxymethylaminomethyl(34) synthesis GTPase MnmE [Desulfosarcina widdelii]BBO76772.1 tRNA modification GTPase MnmE [Desulfosarcina widdelii]
MKHSTIAAISTPLGPGGIGIIRISGPEAKDILKRVFIRAEKGSSFHRGESNPFRSHRVYYGKIIDPHKGRLIDEALAIYMKAPKSFTREDVVELQSHSGFVVLDRILNAVIDSGALIAEPGEFTKRAFMNGRIDLSQAEAVIDMINAPCEAAVYMASQQMMGILKESVDEIRSKMISLRAQLEVELEFSDQNETQMGKDALLESIQHEILQKIARLVQNQKEAAIYRDGVLLSIAGLPNVGKSSLLNQLVQKETAIVSEVPGTTRDIVREYLTIRGVPIVLCDTAGLHDSLDPIECLGVQKARKQIQESDNILFVIDASRDLLEEEKVLIESLKTKRTLFLINKIDIADKNRVKKLEGMIQQKWVLPISAKTGKGIDQLKELLLKGIVESDAIKQMDAGIPNLRQRQLLDKAYKQISQCVQDVSKEYTLDRASEKLNDAIDTLGSVCGTREREDLYDTIFSQFCIGK